METNQIIYAITCIKYCPYSNYITSYYMEMKKRKSNTLNKAQFHRWKYTCLYFPHSTLLWLIGQQRLWNNRVICFIHFHCPLLNRYSRHRNIDNVNTISCLHYRYHFPFFNFVDIVDITMSTIFIRYWVYILMIIVLISHISTSLTLWISQCISDVTIETLCVGS